MTRPPTGEWNDVPRLQRVLAEPIAPVAINDRFRDSLASFTDPSLMTPMSHRVDPTVGGLVDGLVTTGQRGGGYRSPELVVPRPAAPAAPAIQRRVADWAVVPMEYPDVTVAPEAVAESPSPTDPASDVESPPDVGQPVDVAQPADAVQPVVRASEGSMPTAVDPPAAMDLPVAGPVGVRSVPVQRSEVDHPVRGVEPVAIQRSAAAAPSAPARTAEPTIARRPVEAPAVVQRTLPVVPTPATTPAPTIPAVQRSAEVGFTEVPLVLAEPSEPSIGEAVPEAEPVAMPIAASGPTEVLKGISTSSISDVPVGRSGISTSSINEAPVAPSEVSRGVQVELPVSRSVVSSGISTSSISDVPVAPHGVSAGAQVELPVSRSAVSSGISTGSISDVPVMPVGISTGSIGDVPVGLSGISTSSISERTTAQVAPPIVAVQRRSASTISTPAASTPAVSALPVPAFSEPAVPDAVQRVSAAPATVSPQPPLTLVRPASVRTPGEGQRLGEGMSFVSMFADFADQSPMEASVQRETTEDAPAAAEPAPAESAPPDAAASAAAPAAAAAAVGAASGAAGGNVDELARRLYEPLAARLREELWLDRERAGWLTDVAGG
ncbi:MAG: hypothetical protein QM619_02670 [Micropruina sp.]|uniref:hypothetical protein n=1 Tax=Micropruina sp. TaxID=2737536 RepID=UPI0039E35AEC